MVGDCRERAADLEAGSVRCCVTSPPYFGLRDYGVAGQIGLEATPDAYVAELVDVFRHVRRALSDDGTVWLNLGDSYNNSKVGNTNGTDGSGLKRNVRDEASRQRCLETNKIGRSSTFRKELAPGLKVKDLLMIPARVALALQADGWYLRSHIIWHKPNPMPESVRDRPTSAHESVFLLSKGPRYFYDADAVREAGSTNSHGGGLLGGQKKASTGNGHSGLHVARPAGDAGRNMRNVWTITPKHFKGAHFATFPPALAERCIKAGSAPGDTVLDPFFGAGTVGLVAEALGRECVGVELNADYARLAAERIGLAAVIDEPAPAMAEVA